MAKPLQWALRIGGLVAVAVISGLIWYFVTDDDKANSDPTGYGTGDKVVESEGVYDFRLHEDLPKPRTDTNCADHAYGQIQEFLRTTRCEKLTRALYVTTVQDGRTVYASVSVVRMADDAAAEQLRKLTDTDDTGNVSDVVRDRVVRVDGLDRLSGGGGYASTQHGRDVVIVEADFDPKGEKGTDEKADEEQLDSVCMDALRLDGDISRR